MDMSDGDEVGSEGHSWEVSDVAMETDIMTNALLLPADWSPATRMAALMAAHGADGDTAAAVLAVAMGSPGGDGSQDGEEDMEEEGMEADAMVDAAESSGLSGSTVEGHFPDEDSETGRGVTRRRGVATPPPTVPAMTRRPADTSDSDGGSDASEGDDGDNDDDAVDLDGSEGSEAAEGAAPVDDGITPSEQLVKHADEKGYYITPAFRCGSAVAGRLKSLNDDCIWTLSSARPGNGIDEVLSSSREKFWQSDGVTPHNIVIQFYKRESVAEISMYLPYPVDESYCPQRIVIRAGNTLLDFEEVRRVELDQPNGYVRIPFVNREKAGLQRYLRCHMLQIIFASNHQQGRDCHVRCLQVLGPAEDAATASRRAVLHPSWETPEMGMGLR